MHGYVHRYGQYSVVVEKVREHIVRYGPQAYLTVSGRRLDDTEFPDVLPPDTIWHHAGADAHPTRRQLTDPSIVNHHLFLKYRTVGAADAGGCVRVQRTDSAKAGSSTCERTIDAG